MSYISTFGGGVGSLIKDAEDGILNYDGDPWLMVDSRCNFRDDQRVKQIN